MFYIITVPTPILENKSPDLEPLKNASKLVGEFDFEMEILLFMKAHVYPGCTEEFCVPILENEEK